MFNACRPEISVAVAACLLGVLPSGCGSGPVPAPTAYTKTESADKQFQCVYPAGWKVTATGGKGTLSHSIFDAGAARIDISADIMGSLMAGPALTPQSRDVEPPVAGVHERGQSKFAEGFSNYEEQDAKPIQSVLGEGRISEFTAAGTLGKKLRGYRATFMSRDRRITALCSCPVSEWETLKPAFDKVIASLETGTGR